MSQRYPRGANSAVMEFDLILPSARLRPSRLTRGLNSARSDKKLDRAAAKIGTYAYAYANASVSHVNTSTSTSGVDSLSRANVACTRHTKSMSYWAIPSMGSNRRVSAARKARRRRSVTNKHALSLQHRVSRCCRACVITQSWLPCSITALAAPSCVPARKYAEQQGFPLERLTYWARRVLRESQGPAAPACACAAITNSAGHARVA